MRYKVQPEDFVVEERVQLSFLPQGPFAIYRVRKRGVTTLSVQAQMARMLACRSRTSGRDGRVAPTGCVKELPPQHQLQACEAADVTPARAVGWTRG